MQDKNTAYTDLVHLGACGSDGSNWKCIMHATVSSRRPSSLNIGALFTNSDIGRSAKPAILAPIDEVNYGSKSWRLKVGGLW
ncbi:hypothetical protein RchiOBHm_Chr1g0324131 [Rosa chinensis]|uniref:Uncharacterized protein n=1 Tax=Rosa chinensis TaxID=74649 RepID=A0A2P6S9L9_ROSCH|nr:hypothetical protein RchiOBHm_Chr1g0324131 [Rosa chinensis]